MPKLRWKPTAIDCLRSRACWLLPQVAWALVIGISLQQSIADIHQHSMELAAEGARHMFRMVEMTRLWNARHGGVYVPVTQDMQPNPYLDVPARDLETRDGMRLTMINPAYMTRQIADIADRHDILFHITSLKPLRPGNAPDAWERASLLRFEDGEPEFMQLVKGADGAMFRYMAPLTVRQSCLKCHVQQGYQVGDIRGGVSVSMPADSIFGADAQRVHWSIVKHLLVFGLVSALVLVFLSHARRRWIQVESIRAEQAEIIAERTAHLSERNEELRVENDERRQAEERYRSASQAAHDAIISAEEDGHISAWNAGAQRIFGYREQDIIGRPLSLLVPENSRDAHSRGFGQAAPYFNQIFIVRAKAEPL